MDYSKRWIADQALTLIDTHGQNVHLDNSPGYIRKAEVGDFLILYTTPFSGLETLPGWKCYRIEIWFQHLKVFYCAFNSLEALSAKGQSKMAWVKQIRQYT